MTKLLCIACCFLACSYCYGNQIPNLTLKSAQVNFAGERYSIQTFYINPTPEHFQVACEALYRSEEGSDPFMTDIFIRQVRSKHPTFTRTCEEHCEGDNEIISLLKTAVDTTPDAPRFVDYLWISFFATGEPIYLEQVLKHVACCEEDAFVVVYQVCYLPESPSARGSPHEFIRTVPILWSLKANMQRDETIRGYIETIFREKPELDYRERFRRLTQRP